MRYAKANNPKVPDYDDTQRKSWLIYQDCKYNYSKFFQKNCIYLFFKTLQVTTYTSMINLYLYEVDVTYPLDLHDKHNNLPFLPENGIPAGSKVKKLMATFESKKNYVVHYRSLQQAIKNGLIVNKVCIILYTLNIST